MRQPLGQSEPRKFTTYMNRRRIELNFNHGLALIGLLVLATVGCSPSSTSTTELTPDLEAEIVAHDADVDAAERAQK